MSEVENEYSNALRIISQNRYSTALDFKSIAYIALFLSVYIANVMNLLYKVSLVSYFFLIKKVKLVHKRCSVPIEKEIQKKVGYHGYRTTRRFYEGPH